MEVEKGEAGRMAAEESRREAVVAELDRVLAGPAFRNSRRSQEFLRYIVTHSLNGELDLVKERTIGITVFQRPPDYDTGEDSIVRVKASELRKRLAQHYLESGAASGVRIELPAGSYVPEFRLSEGSQEAPSVVPVRRKRLPVLWLAASLGVLGLAALSVFYVRGRTAVPLDQFWRPVFDSPHPVLLSVANPVVYDVTGRTRAFLDLNPADKPASVPGAELVRDPDHYVGVGDAIALAQLSGFFSRRGKETAIRMGTDMSFTDLRNSPAVLIGAFSNQWTMQMTRNLRFVFGAENGLPLIRDQMDPSRRWVRDGSNPNADYVLLSRIFDSRSGELVLTAAGLAHAGTQMAGEFLTNRAYFAQAVRNAPPDWVRRNMQLVVAGEVIGKTPGPPRLVADWYW